MLKVCNRCGSDKTTDRWWNHDKENNGLPICRRCYNNHIRYRSPESIRKEYVRRYTFKSKLIYHNEVPRKGVCSKCGARAGIECKRTQLHHTDYDSDNPLAHTIELCASCHGKETWKQRKILQVEF